MLSRTSNCDPILIICVRMQKDEEASVNLLEQIVGFFIRVRSHSFVGDVKERYKANIVK